GIRGSGRARGLSQLCEQRVDAVEARQDLEAALGGQDEIDLAVGERAQDVGRAHPGRRDELTPVVLAFVTVGRAHDEEARVVSARRTFGRDPARELDEIACVDRYPALFETFAGRGGPELVDAERGGGRGV